MEMVDIRNSLSGVRVYISSNKNISSLDSPDESERSAPRVRMVSGPGSSSREKGYSKSFSKYST